MEVTFYILFLLVASPVKKEDACRTEEKQGRTVAVTPTVKIDRVLPGYEYGHEITVTWSVTDLTGYVGVVNFNVKLVELSDAHIEKKLVFEKQVQQHKSSSADYTVRYKIQKLLDPGNYRFDVLGPLSNNGKSKTQAFVILKVKEPSLNLVYPTFRRYEHGDDVALKWSMAYGKDKVKELTISVWNTAKTPLKIDKYHPLKDDQQLLFSIINTADDNLQYRFTLPQIPDAGDYKWTMEGTSPDEQTMKSRGAGIYEVVAIPVPVLVPSLPTTYEHNQKVSVEWTIVDPKKIIQSYQVLLWKVDVNNPDAHTEDDPKVYDVTCADIRKCTKFDDFEDLAPGKYQCNVLVKSARRQRTSADYVFVVNPDPRKDHNPRDDYEYTWPLNVQQ